MVTEYNTGNVAARLQMPLLALSSVPDLIIVILFCSELPTRTSVDSSVSRIHLHGSFAVLHTAHQRRPSDAHYTGCPSSSVSTTKWRHWPLRFDYIINQCTSLSSSSITHLHGFYDQPERICWSSQERRLKYRAPSILRHHTCGTACYQLHDPRRPLRHSFRSAAPHVWNGLISDARSAASFETFLPFCGTTRLERLAISCTIRGVLRGIPSVLRHHTSGTACHQLHDPRRPSRHPAPRQHISVWRRLQLAPVNHHLAPLTCRRKQAVLQKGGENIWRPDMPKQMTFDWWLINVIFCIIDIRKDLTCANNHHTHTYAVYDMPMANRQIYRYA